MNTFYNTNLANNNKGMINYKLITLLGFFLSNVGELYVIYMYLYGYRWVTVSPNIPTVIMNSIPN